MYIPKNPYSEYEIVAYFLLGVAIISFVLRRTCNFKKCYYFIGVLFFNASLIYAVVFSIQDFYYVFRTQNIPVGNGLIWSRYSGVFIAFLIMALTLIMSTLVEYEFIQVSKKAENVINICVAAIVIICYEYYRWSISLITDVDIKLLLFHISSLDNYKIFPFVIYCFTIINTRKE